MHHIHTSAIRGCEDCVKYLVEIACISIDLPDTEGNTPLIWASFRGNLNIVRYLIKQGANLE